MNNSKRIKVYVFFVVIILLVIISMLFTFSKPVENDVNTQYLRLHILANSDSEEDQSLKLQVRDAVYQTISNALIDCSSLEESMACAEEILDEINSIATEVSGEDISVYLGVSDFPDRWYDDLFLPAGKYQAIIVEIGCAEGANWWCVAFPPLCFIDGEDISGEEIVLEWKISQIWDKFTSD